MVAGMMRWKDPYTQDWRAECWAWWLQEQWHRQPPLLAISHKCMLVPHQQFPILQDKIAGSEMHTQGRNNIQGERFPPSHMRKDLARYQWDCRRNCFLKLKFNEKQCQQLTDIFVCKLDVAFKNKQKRKVFY